MSQQFLTSLQEPGMSRHCARKSNTRLILLLSSIEENIRAMLFSLQTLIFLSFDYLIKDYSELISRRLQARFVFCKCSRFFTLVIEATESIHLEFRTVIHIYFFHTAKSHFGQNPIYSWNPIKMCSDMRECSLAWLTISNRYELSSFVAWVTNSQNKDVSKKDRRNKQQQVKSN